MNWNFRGLDSADKKLRLSVGLAKMFVGIIEEGGNNNGQMVEQFQKAVDGYAGSLPWCMSFCQYIAKQTDMIANFTDDKMGKCKFKLYPTEHVMTCWRSSSPKYVVKCPKVGHWVVWNHLDRHGKPTNAGHVEIISKVLGPRYVSVIGGNTGGPSTRGVIREGDGVWEKYRTLRDQGPMKFVGLLSPW